MLSGKVEMEEKIIDHNISHLNKCTNTPFGSGNFFNQIHDKDTRGVAIKNLLCGTSGWRHRMKEVEEFIEDLKNQYSVQTLETKAKEMGDLTSYMEYRDYFAPKRESTESSNSGQHIATPVGLFYA